ncbi:MAG: hypothetical protein U9P00_06245 [Pseudomonadota bacterium]|nr:hypothetical protein [Pseudomonadota bacterium]
MAKLIVTLLTLFLAFAASAGAEALLNRLQVDHEALIAVERDFQRHRQQGTLGAAEAADYAEYVARLRERVSQDCLMLARAGIRPPDELPCPASLSTGTKPVTIDRRSEQTRAERTATMDAELNAGLGEFDEMLLREQERVKAAAPRAQGSDGAGGGSGQGGGQGAGDTGAEGGQRGDAGESGDVTGTGDPSARGAVGDQPPSGATGGGGTRTGARGQPAGIPDGSDDDLVARQMREAAEKETNPELKKRLWEEYRKYKQGTR